MSDKIHFVINAMLKGIRIFVTTQTRQFDGLVYEVGISPWEVTPRARVVDDEGRVHYFFIERAEVS